VATESNLGGTIMYTVISFGMIALIGIILNREQNKDSGSTDDNIRYTRQDIRAVAWLLAAVIVMLGIIADRIH
jgi:hypothetical protein